MISDSHVTPAQNATPMQHYPHIHPTGRALISYWLPSKNEVWGKVMFLHLSVILFMGWGCLPHCMLGYTQPLGPEADTPGQTPLLGRHPLGRHPP